jgi:hypothetical protein
MGLQTLAALVEGDGILEVDFALFQARDNGFQLAQGRFKAKPRNVGRRGFLLGCDGKCS